MVVSGFFELEEVWWKWVDETCPYKTSRARGKWMQESTFKHDGTVWTRTYQPMKSNTGKSTVDRSIYFVGADGRRFESVAGAPNRRNDPERNHGLPRSRGYK